MKLKYLYLLLTISLVACNSSDNVKIHGVIKDAQDKIVYLEENNLNGSLPIDSFKLKEDGHFKFKFKKSVYPEFYQLRIGNQRTILAVGIDKNIEVLALADDMLHAKIIGSIASEEIQELRISARQLQTDFSELSNLDNGEDKQKLISAFDENLEKHKNRVKGLVLANPNSMSAYYGLFQQIGDNYIFTPYERDDRNYFQAVATAFHTNIPEFERSKNLYTLVLDALQYEREMKNSSKWGDEIDVEELSIIDIELPDRNGYPKRLSDNIGSLIVLDFTIYALENNINHTFELREIYDRYSDKDLKIYQVSLDENRHFWQQNVSSTPWVCVNDIEGKVAITYNIQEIPTMFLINKEGEIIGRFSNYQELNKAIARNI